MRLLLDSQALLWAMFEPLKLSTAARAALSERANSVFVSAISPYELETKKAARRLSYPDIGDWESAIVAEGFALLPVLVAHGVVAANLRRVHGDPWDRLLIGQASVEALVLVTSDRHIPAYGVPTLW